MGCDRTERRPNARIQVSAQRGGALISFLSISPPLDEKKTGRRGRGGGWRATSRDDDLP